MKREYDFSTGERGKFYRPNSKLNIPIYLDEDVAEFVQKYAKRKKVDTQTAANEILRVNKEMLQALRSGADPLPCPLPTRANSSCMYGLLPLDCQIQRRIWQSAVSCHPVH